uniref:Uncharacterized protein n=1 Tax=Anguilla anguilla TaxID=7936 RepID=A0A0E9QU07_ANGAN
MGKKKDMIHPRFLSGEKIFLPIGCRSLSES